MVRRVRFSLRVWVSIGFDRIAAKGGKKRKKKAAVAQTHYPAICPTFSSRAVNVEFPQRAGQYTYSIDHADANCCSHLTLLLCIIQYFFSYITFRYHSRWAQTSYRLAFVSAAATYGIVVYKAYKARVNAGAKSQSAFMLAADENVQYLCKCYAPFHRISQLLTRPSI